MKVKKEACPSAPTPEQANTFLSNHNDTLRVGSRSFRIASFLLKGKEHAISGRRLVDMLGFRSVRELQKEIERERNAGAVILSTCTDGGGYFLPDNPDEIRRFIRTLSARARNTFRALESARAELQRIEGDRT